MTKKRIYMKVISRRVIALLSIFGLSQVWAQSMPEGNLNEVFQCSINPGFTFEQVLEVGRAIERGPDGPSLVFYRQPIVASSDRVGTINVVRYWDNFEHMNKGLEATQNTASAASHWFTMVDCGGSRRVGINRNIDSSQSSAYEGGDLDSTLVSIRSCQIAKGHSAQDVYSGLLNFDQSNRQAGDRSGYGFVQMIMGGNGSKGSGIAIRTIGENPAGLARRLDAMSHTAETPEMFSTCGDVSLWRSHVAHWGL
jgi:hypothetical protein